LPISVTVFAYNMLTEMLLRFSVFVGSLFCWFVASKQTSKRQHKL